MNGVKTNDVLNRLLAVHNRSLPVYLSYATPWTRNSNGKAAETLHNIVESQREYVDRFGELIADSGGAVSNGEFPMYFTSYHDLSFDFLTTKLIELQKRDIQIIEDCVAQLDPSGVPRAVAEESLGAARAHLDALQDLL